MCHLVQPKALIFFIFFCFGTKNCGRLCTKHAGIFNFTTLSKYIIHCCTPASSHCSPFELGHAVVTSILVNVEIPTVHTGIQDTRDMTDPL